jgi:hypothetical protein
MLEFIYNEQRSETPQTVIKGICGPRATHKMGILSGPGKNPGS